RAERRIAGAVLVNQRLERAPPRVVDVGIAGPRSIEAPRRLAALDLRYLVRLDEEEGGCGINEPTNGPGRGGAVHANVPARHPLHASSSLGPTRDERRARSGAPLPQDASQYDRREHAIACLPSSSGAAGHRVDHEPDDASGDADNRPGAALRRAARPAPST